MSVRIAVAPVRLRHAAAAAQAVGVRLLEVRGQLGATMAGLDPALGGAGARSAFDSLWMRLTDSIEGLAGDVVALAGTLEAAAERYEHTDRDTMPAGRDAAPRRGSADAAAW